MSDFATIVEVFNWRCGHNTDNELMSVLVQNWTMKSQLPIIADKELFRLWYEFYRLALDSNDKDIQRALKKSADFYAD